MSAATNTLAVSPDVLLDVESARRILAQDVERTSPGTRLDGLSVRYARHKTFRKTPENSYVEVLYELALATHAGMKTQLVYALAGSSERCHRAFVDSSAALLPGGPSTPLRYVAELGQVFWSFPADPVLQFLPELSDRDRCRLHLPYSGLPSAFSISSDVSVESVSVASYRPRTRCTFEYILRTGRDAEARLRIFAKMYAPGTHDPIAQLSRRLCEAVGRTDGTFRLAAPIGASDRLSTLWFEGLPGRTALDAMRSQDEPNLVRRIAHSLATLHRCGFVPPTKSEAARNPQDVLKKLKKLQAASESLESQTSQLERWLGGYPSPALQLYPIHGDFHAQQLIVDRDDVGLVDLDEVALGEPAQDVANFIADLWTTDLPSETIKTVSDTLVEAYREHVPWALPPDRLRYHLVVQLINRSYRAMLSRSDSWLQISRGHLAQALLVAQQ